MVKVARCLLLSVLLVCVCASALAERPMVVDDAELFSPNEIVQMEKIIRKIRDKYQMDAVVLTTRATPYTSRDAVLVDYADRYYEDNGYGLGQDRAGIIYMIDMNNRFAWLSTAGVMIDYLNDSRLDRITEKATRYLSSGDYGGAACRVLEAVEEYLRQGIAEGSFRYDAVTGERLTGLYNRLTTSEALLALVVGLIVTVAIVLSVRGSYALAHGTYRYDLASQASCKLTQDDEQFLRQTVSRVRTPPPSSGGGHSGGSGGHSGGSAVHHSSGGMSHGGGGGRF